MLHWNERVQYTVASSRSSCVYQIFGPSSLIVWDVEVAVFSVCFDVKYHATLSVEFLRTNQLIFVMEMLNVFCDVRTDFEDVIWITSPFKGLIRSCLLDILTSSVCELARRKIPLDALSCSGFQRTVCVGSGCRMNTEGWGGKRKTE
jgi:hypothetical protein